MQFDDRSKCSRIRDHGLRPGRRRPQPSTAQISVRTSSICHGSARSLDGLGHGLGPLPQVAAHRLTQRRQAGAGDMSLVSRYQLLGESRTGRVLAHKQINEHLSRGLGSAAPPGQTGDPRPQLRNLDHPDVFDGACDQIVERREVVSGRRQGRPARRATARCRTASNPPSASSSAAALTSAYRRRSPFGVTAAVTRSHRASQSGTALPFWPNGHGMIARMPDLSRRAVLGLGASAAVGAVGGMPLTSCYSPEQPGHAGGHSRFQGRHSGAVGTGAERTPRAATLPSRLRRRPRW